MIIPWLALILFKTSTIIGKLKFKSSVNNLDIAIFHNLLRRIDIIIVKKYTATQNDNT